MIDMDTVNELAALFHIHKESLGHPGLGAIRTAAEDQLKSLNDKIAAMKQDLAEAEVEEEPEETDPNVKVPKELRR